MPDFGDLEKEAESHSQQVDEGVQKAEQAGDKEAAGRDDGMIDKGGAELEKEISQQQ